MFRNLVLFICLFSLPLIAGQFTLDGRLEIQNTYRDLSTLTALYNPNPILGLKLTGIGRLSTSIQDVETLGYGFDVALPVLPFLEISGRLSHENWLASTTAQTHLLFLANLGFSPFSFLKLFAVGGWYKRNVRLNKPYLFPTLAGSSYNEHDFAVSFGTEIAFNDALKTLFKVATFEELSVYNLNNPFIQGQITYTTSPDSWKWTLYSRYRLLLGFGRLDSFSAGINLAVILTP